MQPIHVAKIHNALVKEKYNTVGFWDDSTNASNGIISNKI
jgi:hypothetical protein